MNNLETYLILVQASIRLAAVRHINKLAGTHAKYMLCFTPR